MKKFLAIAVAWVAFAAPALAQWQVPQYAVPLGRGPGTTGFLSAAPGTTGRPLVSQGAAANPVFGTALVAGGGTGLTSGTSGGLLYFSSTSTMASSGAITGLVLGNGAGAAPTAYAGTNCSDTLVRSLNASGVATCSQVQTADIADNATTNAKLATAGAATLKGNPTSGTANVQDFAINSLTHATNIVSNTDSFLVHKVSTGTLQFTTLDDIVPSLSVVRSLNALTGNLTLAAGTGISISTGAGTITVNAASGTNCILPTADTAYCGGAGAATAGTKNTALGAAGTLGSITTGTQNVAIGYLAGSALTTAESNVLIGVGAGAAITVSGGIVPGNNNVFIGQQAGNHNTSGGYNVAIGLFAAQWQTTATENTYVGATAGLSTTSGQHNVAIGANALGGDYDGIGPSGTAFTGGSNVAIGYNAMIGAATSSNQNVCIGQNVCGVTVPSASVLQDNTVLGFAAMRLATSSARNAILGFEAGQEFTSASDNILIGHKAGRAITTGSFNTIISSNSSPTSASSSLSNVTVVGSRVDLSTLSNNEVVIADGAGNTRIKASSTGQLTFPHYTMAFTFPTNSGAFTSFPLSASATHFNYQFSVSAAGGALTLALKNASGNDPSADDPVVFVRNSSGSSGTQASLQVSAASSVTISSGSTMGVTSSTAFRLWIVGFDDSGTFRLGLINLRTASGIYPLTQYIQATSTAEGGAGGADSAGVIYTDTAVGTPRPVFILGFIEWTSSGLTAGTWTTTNLGWTRIMRPGLPLPGHVVQTAASSTPTRGTASTSTTYTATGVTLSGSITPTSAANAIRVSVTGGVAIGAGGANADNSVALRVIRGTSGNTQVGANFQLQAPGNGVNDPYLLPGTLSPALDWPNTDASQTYSPQVKTNNAATDITFPYGDTANGNPVGYMLLEEIMSSAPLTPDNDNDPRLTNAVA